MGTDGTGAVFDLEFISDVTTSNHFCLLHQTTLQPFSDHWPSHQVGSPKLCVCLQVPGEVSTEGIAFLLLQLILQERLGHLPPWAHSWLPQQDSESRKQGSDSRPSFQGQEGVSL